MADSKDAGEEALRRLIATFQPSFLAPNPALSETSRAASRHLFSALRPFCPKSPLDQLLIDGFDAEQIWQQIDLQSQPLLSSLRRQVKHFAKNPEEISKLKVVPLGKKVEKEQREDWVEESDGFDEELEDDEEGEGKGGEEGMDIEDEDEEQGRESDNEEESEGEDEEEKGEDGEAGDGGIEDKFLKIDELAKYLEKEEENFEKAEEDTRGKKGADDEENTEDDDDDDEEEEEEEEESDEDAEFGFGGEDAAGDMENARYEDFFGDKGKYSKKMKAQLHQESEGSDEEDDDMKFKKQNKGTASTHQKQLEKIHSKIEEMEKANLEPKTWTMQGEVTAAKRPKNSALEVDLDFEHNVRPAPVITEEVTASIEDMIKKRITEGNFNDVQKAPKLPSKVPREVKELDDNKSKKGLAEIYEQEYVEKEDPTSAPLSFRDEQKQQASVLFKKLGLKLDALAHFSFAPKPVIEDMSVQINVPALAMEEIAPVAVSDAAMLAPEEVFEGKGDIKEETELTKEERKRRRANKKRRFKAAAVKRMGKKVQEGALPNQMNVIITYEIEPGQQKLFVDTSYA
ncbi:U3 small nucleolar ribonucleoprotein protein MPP10 isoform X1 [Arachis ipaensis]|uniref:U3 small nucleolar ribonucleoprotein protein MPP10 isoform X1 n=1 Tax=Arachis ipaensis TaxID=130454 RepID=UPI000A2AF54C|nr:U3 small nucleolar ribonucleoprotein protein MPP10 isoform X1 [Arachis ipaensis]